MLNKQLAPVACSDAVYTIHHAARSTNVEPLALQPFLHQNVADNHYFHPTSHNKQRGQQSAVLATNKHR